MAYGVTQEMIDTFGEIVFKGVEHICYLRRKRALLQEPFSFAFKILKT